MPREASLRAPTTAAVNCARVAQDGEQIHVPSLEEASNAAGGESAAGDAGAVSAAAGGAGSKGQHQSGGTPRSSTRCQAWARPRRRRSSRTARRTAPSLPSRTSSASRASATRSTSSSQGSSACDACAVRSRAPSRASRGRSGATRAGRRTASARTPRLRVQPTPSRQAGRARAGEGTAHVRPSLPPLFYMAAAVWTALLCTSFAIAPGAPACVRFGRDARRGGGRPCPRRARGRAGRMASARERSLPCSRSACWREARSRARASLTCGTTSARSAKRARGCTRSPPWPTQARPTTVRPSPRAWSSRREAASAFACSSTGTASGAVSDSRRPSPSSPRAPRSPRGCAPRASWGP